MNQQKENKTILICPLEWGAGHFTRCIPLIRYFLGREHRVLVAASHHYRNLLVIWFPHLQYVRIPSFRLKRYHSWLLAGLVMQLPRFLFCMVREHVQLRSIVAKYRISLIVSDNRYGLWHRSIPSLLITHQLSPVLPVALWPMRCLVNITLRRLISKFNLCLVPDYPDINESLSGLLSHPAKTPHNLFYCGPLSRFTNTSVKVKRQQKQGYILLLLSGPEPHRSRLEKMVAGQAEIYNMACVIVRGLHQQALQLEDTPYVRYIAFAKDEEFRLHLSQARLAICRAGYSTVMDIIALGCPGVMVPTPGQSEQEYLAAWLSRSGRFIAMNQKDLDLKKALAITSQWKTVDRINPVATDLSPLKKYC